METKRLISLETVLEIEGLVMLINDRREQTPCQIYDLISSKLESLLSEIDSLREEYLVDEDENEKMIICSDETIHERPEISKTVVTPTDLAEKEDVVEKECTEAQKIEPESLKEDEVSKEDMEAIAESAEMEEEEDADVVSATQNTIVSEQLKNTIVASPSLSSDAPSIQSTACPPPPPSNYEETKPAPKSEIPRFSLNDKYVFRRELFNFSDEEMTEALNVVSEMTTAEDVEDYFYNDLCWDPENEIVKHFISIITARFKSRGY